MKKFVNSLLCAGIGLFLLSGSAHAIVSGAGYTTFVDPATCLNGPNEINCNIYTVKKGVYVNGGPQAGGLSDGWYYFAVLVPGAQHGGFVDGEPGNLSDTTKYMEGGRLGEKTDKGSGDLYTNRNFRVAGQEIVEYNGTHKTGNISDGRLVIQLYPFDDTSNPGGVYILAVCTFGGPDNPENDADSPADCKYDAFKVRDKPKDDPPPPFPHISGMKYFDANANGQRDEGEPGIEPGIAGWNIDITDGGGITSMESTDGDGIFSTEVMFAGTKITLTVAEQLADGWIQTGNTVDNTVSTGGASAVLNGDMTYTVMITDNGQTVTGLNFGNICVLPAAGLTRGFWHNQNGGALIEGDPDALTILNDLPLRGEDPGPFVDDFADWQAYADWVVGQDVNGKNMANMLSAQLTATVMNLHFPEDVGLGNLIQVGTIDPILTAEGIVINNGFVDLNEVIKLAIDELYAGGAEFLNVDAAHPKHALFTALKDLLDRTNNGEFESAADDPAQCSLPVFP